MTKALQAFVAFVGRFLLGVFFFYGGLMSAEQWSSRLGQMPDWLPMHGVLLGGALALLLVGPVLIVLGAGARVGAVMLMIFLGVVTPIMHPMWSQPDQTFHFMRNMSFFGGCTMLLAYGPGLLSLDHLFGRRRRIETEQARGEHEHVEEEQVEEQPVAEDSSFTEERDR